ncbi:MAG: FAD:protein FMN transferase [Acidimicrobiales bacterium]
MRSDAPDPVVPPNDVEPATESGYWRTYRWRAMGSEVELLIGGATDADGLAAWAREEIERLEQCWSRFRANSELVALNNRSGQWVDVSTTLATALRSATRWWRDTGGAFDPTVIEALESWGYNQDFRLIRASGAGGAGGSNDASDPPRAAPGLTGMASLHDYHSVRLPPGVRVDLGGIGKGLAADVVAQELLTRGAPSVLVSMGGDLAMAGAAPSGGYPVPVLDPFDTERVLFTHALFEGALVTSTTRIRRWRAEDTPAHHLIDPRTGCPATHGLAAVFVAAPSCAQAEVLAKSVLVSGDVRLPMAMGAGTSGWTVDDDGQLRALPAPSVHGALAA